jgi:cell division protein FtsB
MLKKTGYVAAVALLAAYAFVAFRGPQGVGALTERRGQIRQLQEQNADLAREVQLKRDRINRLKFSQAEQELEIRKRLKLQRPGEMDFVLPEKPQPPQ